MQHRPNSKLAEQLTEKWRLDQDGDRTESGSHTTKNKSRNLKMVAAVNNISGTLKSPWSEMENRCARPDLMSTQRLEENGDKNKSGKIDTGTKTWQPRFQCEENLGTWGNTKSPKKHKSRPAKNLTERTGNRVAGVRTKKKSNGTEQKSSGLRCGSQWRWARKNQRGNEIQLRRSSGPKKIIKRRDRAENGVLTARVLTARKSASTSSTEHRSARWVRS
jgi:hypothetical protein